MMLRFCKKSAAYANGVLVLDVSKSKVPGVVRVDLSATPYSHFHVRSNDEGSVLGYSDSAARFTPLALFADRRDADTALAHIQQRLTQPPVWARYARNVFMIALAIYLILLVSGWIAGALMSSPASSMAAATTEHPAVSGKPRDAEEMFNGE